MANSVKELAENGVLEFLALAFPPSPRREHVVITIVAWSAAREITAAVLFPSVPPVPYSDFSIERGWKGVFDDNRWHDENAVERLRASPQSFSVARMRRGEAHEL